MIEQLNDMNFELFAANNYDNPSCLDHQEFSDDLKRIKYLKRLFRKYRQTGILRERLIINHLVVFYNVFYPEAATKMLCFKLSDHLEELKPFLLYMSFWPSVVNVNEDLVIQDSDVGMDSQIVDTLRKL